MTAAEAALSLPGDLARTRLAWRRAVRRVLDRAGAPYVKASYDAAGCTLCGQREHCPGVHTVQEVRDHA